MSAGHDQREKRELQRGIGKKTGVEMAFEVVNADKWDTERISKRLRRGNSHQECSNQAGSVCHCNTLDILKTKAGRFERLFNNRQYTLNVFSGCYLGNYPAPARVKIRLACDY